MPLRPQQGCGNHGVERDPAHFDAVILEHGHIVVGVVRNLRDGLALEHRSERFEYVIQCELPALAMPYGNVPAHVWRVGKRKAHEVGGHGIDSRRFGIEREPLR